MFIPSLLRLPPVPSNFPVYLSTQTTTTNEDTTTFASVGIGTPHPKRVIVLAVYHGIGDVPTGSINGIPCTVWQNQSNYETSMMYAPVPTGLTANIVITAAASFRKAVSVYATYPNNANHVDRSQASSNVADLVLSGNVVQKNGWLIWSIAIHAAEGTFTQSWDGVDTPIEDADSIAVEVSTFCHGHINFTASGNNALTLTGSIANQKRAHALVWGPAYGND